jgi:transposase
MAGGIGHFFSRLFGGPSHAEKRARQSLLDQEEESRREAEARRDALVRLRRSISAGRRSLLSWFDDGAGQDTIGA